MATSGPRYPGTLSTTSTTPYTSQNWVSVANMGGADTTYASVTHANYDTNLWTYEARLTNFGFSIPNGSTVNGITVEINGYGANGANSPQHVQLTKNGTAAAGSEYGITTSWPATPGTTRTLGGSADKWGTTWTVSEVNASTFGVLFANKATADNADVYIDYVRVTVTYTEPVSLTASTLSSGTPSVGGPIVGQKHSLTATGISGGIPSASGVAVKQVHALVTALVSSGAPTFGTPELAEAGGTDALEAVGVTASPSVGGPVISQAHQLSGHGLSTSVSVSTPVIGQVHGLSGVSVSAGQSVVDHPVINQVHLLSVVGLLDGSPAVGAPALTQKHALLAAGVFTGSPLVDAVDIHQSHILTASVILAGTPFAESSAITQAHLLLSSNLSTGLPVLGLPVIGILSGSSRRAGGVGRNSSAIGRSAGVHR